MKLTKTPIMITLTLIAVFIAVISIYLFTGIHSDNKSNSKEVNKSTIVPREVVPNEFRRQLDDTLLVYDLDNIVLAVENGNHNAVLNDVKSEVLKNNLRESLLDSLQEGEYTLDYFEDANKFIVKVLGKNKVVFAMVLE